MLINDSPLISDEALLYYLSRLAEAIIRKETYRASLLLLRLNTLDEGKLSKVQREAIQGVRTFIRQLEEEIK